METRVGGKGGYVLTMIRRRGRELERCSNGMEWRRGGGGLKRRRRVDGLKRGGGEG